MNPPRSPLHHPLLLCATGLGLAAAVTVGCDPGGPAPGASAQLASHPATCEDLAAPTVATPHGVPSAGEELGAPAAAASLSNDDPSLVVAREMIEQGRHIFRYDTFGDEDFWGTTLRLHDLIAGAANGGVGGGVSPATALSLGIKVDADALPRSLKRDLRRGRVDLNDPATTLALLRMDAVIGLKGFFAEDGRMENIGVTCAFCHTAVDDSFAEGIGKRLDGWPNRDLDVGGIMAALPDLSAVATLVGTDQATLRTTFANWGRGRFDAFFQLDGKLTRPDGGSAAVIIPPLFGMNANGMVTWNGFGSLGNWNPVVAILELHGKGNFSDSRLRDATKYPIAAAKGLYQVRNTTDLVTSKLAPLQFYQYSLQVPTPPEGSFNEDAAERGRRIFMGEGNRARCYTCHVPPMYTLPGYNIVPPSVIGVDSFHADRSPTSGYKIPHLRGMFTRDGAYFHDGRFQTLGQVVEHFSNQFKLGLTAQEQSDVVEFLKSI